MEIVKLKPATKDYIWGGNNLRKWGKEGNGSSIAECWELSFNDAGPSIIASGFNKGKLLKEVATKEDIGLASASFSFFPVLVKLIDSETDLSVQVHPSDAYALQNENQFGKTEMWHILDAKEGAGIYLGFKKNTSPSEVRKAVDDHSIVSLLNFIKVHKGETYFIPSGTVHAIGGGVTLIEIQQNSTLTYRLYDYGRIGKDGKPRELHLEKALNVINYEAFKPVTFRSNILGECPYFVAKKKEIFSDDLFASKDSFLSFMVIEGEGKFANIPFSKGDTFFIPASKGGHFEGEAKIVTVEVPNDRSRD